jgi:ADP-ribosylglycohydrolase
LASLVALRGTALITDKREVEIETGSTKNDRAARAARACGGLLGLLTGDALGVPHEFKSAADIPPAEQIEMVMPSHYKRSYRQVPYGTWSDDGAQALCLLESLFQKEDLDPADLGARLVSWWQEGHMAVDGKVFDIGTQTSQALSRLRAGVAPLEAGAGASTGAGNGSLMRVLSLALWHKGSTNALFEKAMRQSMVTHAALEAQLCCALYCGVADGLLDGLEMDAAWNESEAALRRYCASNAEQLRVLEQRILTSPFRSDPTGTGYVVDALWSARACLRENDYAAVVRAAVRMGCDTDTTAAIAGGLAGIAFTAPGIPAHWLQSLRGRDIAEPLLDALRKHHGGGTLQAPNISGQANSNLLRETIASHGIGSRQSFRNLSVYPLISTTEGGAVSYRLLDEAITEGKVSITEVSEAGHVPELAFANHGDRPVLLIDGQELRGARQNRTLNITILAEPGSELIIPVACVERGRWAYREQHLQSSEEILFSSARAERTRAVSESMRRKTGARADQQRLWQMIDEQLRSAKSSSETDNMADLYESNRDRLASYCQAFTWLPNQAGAVFAIDGKPVAVELFDSPTTFRNHFDKILRSFAVDAPSSTQPIEETGPELRKVHAFLEEVCSADAQWFKAICAGDDMRLASDRISGGALMVEDRVVHLSGFSL